MGDKVSDKRKDGNKVGFELRKDWDRDVREQELWKILSRAGEDEEHDEAVTVASSFSLLSGHRVYSGDTYVFFS